MSKPGLTALIICRNQAQSIRRCIASVKGVASEVLVLDSGSTDQTVALAREAGARVVKTDWPGFAVQKNRGADQAAHPWILSVDADEYLSPELTRSLQQEVKQGLSSALKMNRLNSWCGTWVRFSGWYPDTKIRVYPKEARWQGELHEKLILPASTSVKKCRGHLLHEAVISPQEHWNKVQSYARIRAQQWIQNGRRKLPPFWFLEPGLQFFRTYIVLLGFLDGKAGWQIALLNAKARAERYRQFKQLLLSP